LGEPVPARPDSRYKPERNQYKSEHIHHQIGRIILLDAAGNGYAMMIMTGIRNGIAAQVIDNM
jgi:hypothetical protein